jgi:mannose-6-phosphate isomerase-like protein (cupin superfamily)
MKKISLKDKLSAFSDYWSPKIIAELNGQHVKVAKLKGEFDWHHHEAEDELFLVLDGVLRMDYRDAAGEHTTTLEPGELIVVPRDTEHRPVATEEVAVLLFEPAGTLNTGNVRNDRTVPLPERL